ncbi:DUF934 domain-containing protein [Vreelandella aquamarina]|uniref:DUF934 domain-containing protein n=1 Tax=Vreelandella aquamarina TaxID=77097 RepID=UPI00384D259E
MPGNPSAALASPTDETDIVPICADHLIVNGELAKANAWCVSYDEATLPAQRPAFVPLALWQAHRADEQVAPLLVSDTLLSPEMAAELGLASAIAIDFPTFTDGRGYTLARLLRERFGYQGEIRAVGDILVDQLDYMRRCGFSAMALRHDQDPEDALRAINAISVRYQPDVELRQALFERRQTQPDEREILACS